MPTEDTIELMRQRIEFVLEANEDTGEFMDLSRQFFRATVGQFAKIARRQFSMAWLLGVVAALEIVDLVAMLVAIHRR